MLQEPTREMVEKSLPTGYNKKCPRCGHTRWMAFREYPGIVSCTRCFYTVENSGK